MSKVLVKRYLSFIAKIESSSNVALKKLLKLVKYNVWSITGSNLRKFMINSGMTQIDDLIPGRVDVKYHPVAEDQEWRIPFVKELIDIKYDDLAVPGVTKTNLEQILNFLCNG